MYIVLIDVAAGAGLSGTKMARRIGGVDEFEFKNVGENHNQGVSSLVQCCALGSLNALDVDNFYHCL